MKKYCVNLELAKKLKENEFYQNTLYYLDDEDNLINKNFVITSPKIIEENNQLKKANYYSAPTSDELLKELPYKIKDYYLVIAKCNKGYWVKYWNFGEIEIKHIQGNNLANCLAKMWLYLKKEGYIK